MASSTHRWDFEDITHDCDWPTDLRTLHVAAKTAWETFAELENAVGIAYGLGEDANPEKRGQAVELAGQAWALLKALRAAGDARLGEWITAQTRREG